MLQKSQKKVRQICPSKSFRKCLEVVINWCLPLRNLSMVKCVLNIQRTQEALLACSVGAPSLKPLPKMLWQFRNRSMKSAKLWLVINIPWWSLVVKVMHLKTLKSSFLSKPSLHLYFHRNLEKIKVQSTDHKFQIQTSKKLNSLT